MQAGVKSGPETIKPGPTRLGFGLRLGLRLVPACNWPGLGSGWGRILGTTVHADAEILKRGHGGRQCTSLVVNHRKCAQRTSCFYSEKGGLLQKKSEQTGGRPTTIRGLNPQLCLDKQTNASRLTTTVPDQTVLW